MNIELTIQTMFDNYPTLFKERADCLSHLFCTIGNGYEWYNGELVSVIDAFPDDVRAVIESRLINGKAYQHNKLSLRAESELYEKERIENGFYDEFDKERAEKIKSAIQTNINKLPDDEYYRYPRTKRWGFYVNIPNHEKIDYHKNYAFLWNYPEDIKPDWLAAIEECKTLLREDGFEV